MLGLQYMVILYFSLSHTMFWMQDPYIALSTSISTFLPWDVGVLSGPDGVHIPNKGAAGAITAITCTLFAQFNNGFTKYCPCLRC